MARTFHPIAQTSEAHLRWSMRNRPYETIFAYRWNNTTAPTDVELLALATEVFNVMEPKLVLFLHNSIVFRECYARNVDVEVAPNATYSPVGPFVGTRGGDGLPGNVALHLTKRTGLTGRSRHGGFEFSGFSEADVADDTVQATITNGVASLITSILATRVSGRFIPALASRKLGFSIPLRAVVLPNITTDSSKKRLPKPH